MQLPALAPRWGCKAIALAVTLTGGAAGQTATSLYGTIKRDRGPLEGLIVSVACPAFPGAREVVRANGNGVADARGSYSVIVTPALRGRCQLRIAAPGGHLGQPIDVFVSSSAQRYDLEVDANLGVVVR